MECDTAIGGQMARWLRTPSRWEFQRLIHWWELEAKRLGVTVRLGEKATASALVARAPALVVVATGSIPASRPVARSGSAISEIGPYDRFPPGAHVVVRDEMGGLAALLTAERASLTAARVTLVTSLLHPGEGEGLTTVYPLIRDCAARGIAIVDRAKIERIDGRTVHLTGVFGEARTAIADVDVLVSVLDTTAQADLGPPLMAHDLHVITIGDARLPRDVTAAVADAARLLDSAEVDAWKPPSASPVAGATKLEQI
jgi:hypothetical protein